MTSFTLASASLFVCVWVGVEGDQTSSEIILPSLIQEVELKNSPPSCEEGAGVSVQF